MKAKSLLALALAALPSMVQAADWQVVGSSDDSKLTFYVDMSTVKRNASGHLNYWRKTIYTPPKLQQRKLVKESVFMLEADCSDRRTRGLQLATYYVDGTNEVDSYTGDWGYATPDTLGEAELNTICGPAG